jgi:predicted nuclease of restriction endonuclease-like RecB superfamily
VLVAGVAPLPKRLLSYTVADGELVPAWLGDRDRPWLRDLLGEAQTFVGRPIDELATRWRHSDRDPRAGPRQAIATHVLMRWLRRCSTGQSMSAVRQELYALAATGVGRDQALATVARRHACTAAGLAAGLFDDVAGRRAIRWPEPAPEPARLALAANRSLVQGLVVHARSAEIVVHGAARAMLRTAWLLGAGLAVATTDGGVTTMRWRRDRCAASPRALAALVPLLPWARRYELRADCEVAGDRGLVVTATGDPILPGPEPRLYDSGLEQRFAADFTRLAPDWQLLREPTAVAVPGGLAFPDFELRSRRGAGRWLCEVAGLRDPAALPAKLALLAAHERLVLCLPERSVPQELRDHPRIVPFRRRVPADRVLSVVDSRSGGRGRCC